MLIFRIDLQVTNAFAIWLKCGDWRLPHETSKNIMFLFDLKTSHKLFMKWSFLRNMLENFSFISFVLWVAIICRTSFRSPGRPPKAWFSSALSIDSAIVRLLKTISTKFGTKDSNYFKLLRPMVLLEYIKALKYCIFLVPP